jgi:acyl-CoA dehydrogenase
MWEFETEPEFQEKLDWMDRFVREEVESLDALWHGQAFARPIDPTEVHRVTVARSLLKQGRTAEGVWPSEWLPARQAQAREKFAEYLEHEVASR